MKYVRVERMGKVRWGVLDGEVVHTRSAGGCWTARWSTH